MSTPYTFRNPENSIDSQNHYTKNNQPNFDNIIAIDDEDWEEEDMKEFTREVEMFEKIQKLASEEL